MNISSALGTIGIQQPSGAVLVFVQITDAKPINFQLRDLSDKPVEDYENLYLATGAFQNRTVGPHAGRTTENVAAVMTVPFDMDLHDYLGIPKDDVLAMDDEELWSFIEDQKRDAMRIFLELDIPLHRLDYTGHGLAAHVYLRDAQPEHTVPLQDAHKAIIKRINEHAGFALVDPVRSDPGPGLARIPGTINTKNPAKPRTVSTLIPLSPLTFRLSPQQFIGLAGTAARTRTERPRVIIGNHELGDDLADEIVAAVSPYWEEGSRHTIALGLCGMLAKAGVPMEQTADIISTVSAGDSEAWDRLRAVRTTYDRIASGQEVSGFYTLQRSIGADTLQYLDDKLFSWARQQTAPILIAGGKRTTEQPEPVIYEPMPEAAFYGWFREYRDLMSPTTEASDSYHLAASLTLAGALMGRRVWTEHAGKKLYGNLFTLLVGTAGKSRKDTAMDRAAEMPEYDTMFGSNLHTPPFEVRSGYGSGEKLVADLAESPNIFWKETEATSIFANMKREATRSLRDRLIEAWDTRDFMRNAVKKDAAIATNPYLSLITATQPTRLNTSVTTDDIISGLMSRMIVVPGSPKPKKASPPKPDEATARELYQRIRDAIGQYGSSADQIPAHLQFDPAAQAMIDTWYLTSPDHEDEDLQTITVRYELHIRKIALIFAVSDAATAIRVDHLAAAMEFVEWEGRAVRQMLPEWGAEKETRIEQRILAILKHGPMERRKVQMNCKGKWTAREFGYVFEAMVKNGTIESVVDGKAVVYQIAA